MKDKFILEDNKYYKMSMYPIKELDCEFDFWNIDETISELSYLTHDYFRYYGKFPSKVGKNIIEELLNSRIINPEKDFLLDNYAGSGTSLVEGKIVGLDSAGIDINPFAILACRVKTYNLDVLELQEAWDDLKSGIDLYSEQFFDKQMLIGHGLKDEIIEKIKAELQDVKEQNPDITKWFDEDVIIKLSIIKVLLLELKPGRTREFLVLGYFAIIRRVSNAYDGEVRPHVNKKKRKRDVNEAYYKKISEMISTMQEWNEVTSKKVYSDSFICDNSDLSELDKVLKQVEDNVGKELGVVISHPPYLNCFDYIPVYKLKFIWAKGFDEIYGRYTYEEIKAKEIKSYPVNNDNSINRYFEHNIKVYSNIYKRLKPGGYCCVIIGDCTVKQQLFSVHKTFIKMLEDIGYTVEKISYRSTAYGLGKYAYNFRADYNENEEGKKDAIIYFKK